MQIAIMVRVNGNYAQAGPSDDELFEAPVLDEQVEVHGIEPEQTFAMEEVAPMEEQVPMAQVAEETVSAQQVAAVPIVPMAI